MENNNIILSKYKIKILPRYIKRGSEGLFEFQKELINAILNSDKKIIIMEAPVGSGKTYTIRHLLINYIKEREPLILLYPTKILMECQLNSLKNEIKKDSIKIWPYEEFEANKINLFIYSTDSLVEYAKKAGINVLKESRSELLTRLFTGIQWFSKKGGIITSPDVLYLIMKGNYKGSEKILNTLQNSIVIFDEFHCYYGLPGFEFLIEELLHTVAKKVVLLSATPIMTDKIKEVGSKFGDINYIGFENSRGNVNDICFNYPLDAQICSFKVTDINLTTEILQELIPKIQMPGAIIFDSIFRLRHIKREIEKFTTKNILIREWSGMKKDENVRLDDKTLILGTSSIEVGIDMKFKTLIFEASYWPSSIQRLGRVGRKEHGEVFIFTRKDFSPYLKDKELERDEFENILKKVLNDPKEEIGDEYSFRGKSFKFLLYDIDLKEPFIYNENLFAMYEIDDFIDDWQCINYAEKRKILKGYNISDEKVEELLIYDKIFPMWGILKGKIKDDYDFLSKSDIIFPTPNRNELHVKGYVFYGE